LEYNFRKSFAIGAFELLERLTLMLMSGVDDGSTLVLRSDSDGTKTHNQWKLTLGRKDDNDLCLRNDTFVSRQHAFLIWRDGGWWLEDRESTNGSFLESQIDFFSDERVQGIVPLEVGQLFRVGRTWMRIQAVE
jgi:pSer/pThr/pTyr-binding forkhead associated (FHA) protein